MKFSTIACTVSLPIGFIAALAMRINWFPNLTLLGFMLLAIFIAGANYEAMIHAKALQNLADIKRAALGERD
jgi:hypothetical protein